MRVVSWLLVMICVSTEQLRDKAVSSVSFLLQVLLGVTTAVYCGSYKFMESMAQPTFTGDGSLLDGGIDLNMKEGMAEYVFIGHCYIVLLLVLCRLLAICLLPLRVAVQLPFAVIFCTWAYKLWRC